MSYKPIKFKNFYEASIEAADIDPDEIRAATGGPPKRKKLKMGILPRADFTPYKESISYEIYCEALDRVMLDEGFFSDLVSGIPSFFNNIKDLLTRIEKEFQIGIGTLVQAFKQRNVYAILKAFKFNFQLMWKAIKALHQYEEDGLLKVFKELHKGRIFQKLKSGAVIIDDVLNRYPILKDVSGIAIAGLLLYIWLTGSLIGNADYDLDISPILAALHGDYSIADLFASPAGLENLALFAFGFMTGLSVPWLGSSLYNILLALSYTAVKHLPQQTQEVKTFLSNLRLEFR
jgi:hypothetical protein